MMAEPVYMLQPMKLIQPGVKPPSCNVHYMQEVFSSYHLLFYNRIYIPIILKIMLAYFVKAYTAKLVNSCIKVIKPMSKHILAPSCFYVLIM